VVQKAAEIPKAPQIDETQRLAIKVKSALGADPSLKMLAIDAGASGGVVTLYGTANNRALREKAAQVASKVEGSQVREKRAGDCAGRELPAQGWKLVS